MKTFNLSDAVAFGYLVLVLVNLTCIYCHIKNRTKYSFKDMELHSNALQRELAELDTWVIRDESQSNQD